MTRVRVALTCVLGGALAVGSSAYAQRVDQSGSDAVENAADKEAIAESIVAREEAASRAFDPAFRAKAKADLASRSLDELAAVQRRGFGLFPESPHTLGASSAADLVFTPVAPCRIINTRLVGGPIAGGTTRNFLAAAGNYSGQGGFAGSCGVPFGPTTAVVVNIVAVDAAGAGDLRGFPYGGAVPTASIINYAKVPDQVNPSLVLNVANGLVLKICDPAAPPGGGCTNDLTIQADVSATQVVADVLGFFRKVDSTMNQYAFTATGIVAGDNYYYHAATFVPQQNLRCFVACDETYVLGAPHTTGGSFQRVALRNDTAATDTNFPYGMYLPAGNSLISGNNTAIVPLTAGNTYRFGCYVAAGGDLVNASTFIYFNTTVHCQ